MIILPKVRRRSQLVASLPAKANTLQGGGASGLMVACHPAAAKAGEQRRGTMPAVLAAGATNPRHPLGAEVHNTPVPFFCWGSSNSSLYRTPFPPPKHRRDLLRTPRPILPYTFLATQKSGLSARGTSASFPGYHWMFSAQACSAQAAGPPPPLP